MSERDTHFQGFAKLLLEELLQDGEVWIDTGNPHWRDEWERTIAQRAYDLAHHTILNVSHIDLDRLDMHEIVERTPDPIKWTEEGVSDE